MPPRKRAAVYARRRRRRLAAQDHDLTAEQWSELQTLWNGCAYCGEQPRSLQRDCILPISRGGRYCRTNVVPACSSCNASKCNDEVTAWMRRKGLDERRFLLRHAEVLALLSAEAASSPGADADLSLQIRPAGDARRAHDPHEGGKMGT